MASTSAAPATGLSSVIVDTSASPYAAHRPIPVGNVRLRDGVLASRIYTTFRESIPGQFEVLRSDGHLRNFKRAAGNGEGNFEGLYFNDSDVYKWLEAACWAIVGRDDEATAELRGMIDEVVPLILAAQREDGYLNTYFAGDRADERWTNLTDKHELYCAGHLIQAAIAHHRATGSRDLLDAAVRFADHIDATFGPGKLETTDGHPEIEMALVELFRATGERRYLDLATYFIDIRGTGAVGGDDYHQDATPLRMQREMVGHAVRAVYLNAGAADLVAETGDRQLRDALGAMLANMLEKRSYITGGIGQRYEGESFGTDYELPNHRAYAETCAAIGAVMWLWRMLLLEAVDDSRLADVIERVVYNAVLPGISLDGQSYFYQNPLRDDGTHRRQPWFDCWCCPPNAARFLAQLPGYAVTTSTRRFGESDARHDIVWLHQFAQGDYTVPLQDGGQVSLKITTRYPWDGDIAIEVTALEEAGDFTLQVRVPDWAFDAHGTINGEKLPAAETTPGQYLTLRRLWQVGDTVRLKIPMPVRRIVSHPRVAHNTGKVALMRGPLVYCVEETDNPVGDVRDIIVSDDILITAAQRPEMLDDVVVLSAHAEMEAYAPAWHGALYRNVSSVKEDRPGRSEVQVTAIPYMSWANRGAGPMAVWLRREQS
jgi:DUF1680 family protein